MAGAPEITVGLSISLTGALARQGQQAFHGLRLWESSVNARRTPRQGVRLIYYDDESRAGRARQNAVRLLDEDRVDAIFGPYGSGLTLAVAEITEERKKLLWNHGGSSDEIFHRGYRYLVGGPSPASDYFRSLAGQALARTSAGRPGAPGRSSAGLALPVRPRIGVVYSARGTFAAHVARGVIAAAEAAGFPPVECIAIGNLDVMVAKLRALHPDVLVLAASFLEEVEIMRTRRLWPATVKEVAAVAAGVRAFYDELGEEAEGIIGPSQWEPEARFPGAPRPDSGWFVRSFQQQFCQPPEYTAAGSFAMGLIFEECARRAGGLEDLRLREEAAALDFQTFYGRFRMDPETGRQTGHQILLVRWQKGRRVILDKLFHNL